MSPGVNRLLGRARGPHAQDNKCHNGAMTDAGAAHVEEEQLVLHYLGELDPARSDEVHRHLTSCPPCGAQAREIVETMAALTLAELDRAPSEDSPGREGR